jgi:cbb3-type cytochrome c oxidase subunit III
MSIPEARRGRARALPTGVGLILCLAAAACRQDMFNQPKVKPLAQSDFFEDGSGARPPVEGTVARGELRADRVFNTAIGPDGTFVGTLPVPLTRALLLRGQERFNIFCSPCHGRVGDGRGMIVERGFKEPPSYHIDRLRAQPIGYFFDVMTNGFGQMSGYAAQVPPADRWAIAAYIRALQMSQHASVGQVPARDRAEIEKVRP